MPGESPTKWQAQAYRFGVRRLESAVAAGDPLLRSDPLRRRLNISLIISVVIAALVLGVFAIIGFVRPDPTIGNAAVVIDSDSGGAFVARNGVLYPAMNLASALLAAGNGQSGNGAPATITVGSNTIGKEPRGPQLGIPGAPNVLSHKLIDPRWTVCDTTTLNTTHPSPKPHVTTTVILGQARPTGGQIGSDAMLVQAPGTTRTFLLFDGRRAPINPDDQTIRLAFGLRSTDTPRPISSALLNAIPPSPEIAAPTIPRQGERVPYAQKLGVRVGDVFSLERADQTKQIYVALADGVEQITPLLGNLIRDKYSEDKKPPLVKPVLLSAAPRAEQNTIDTTIYPDTQPNILGFREFSTACMARTGTSGGNTTLYAFRSVPLPAGARPVAVTKPSDLPVDRVYVQPGWAGVFASVLPSQTLASGRPLYLIDDQGVAYPVVSPLALSYLGYSESDVRATAQALLRLLPQGPTLDPSTAVDFYPQTGATARSLPTANATPAAPG